MQYTKDFLIQRAEHVKKAVEQRKQLERIENGLPPIRAGDTDFKNEISFVKIIKSGHLIETYEYQNPVWLGNKQGGRLSGGQKSMREDEIRKNTTRKARNTIRRIVNMNFDTTSKFVTLTFREDATLSGGTPLDIRNVKQTNQEFKKFIQRLKRYLEKHGGSEDFKYLAVIEFQDLNRQGVVHYHMIMNTPYIPNKILAEEIWTHGFVGINKIDNCDNVGAYLVKYMMKDLDDTRLQDLKSYLNSKGLTRPEVISGELAHRMIQDLERENKKNKVYEDAYPSDYCGQIEYTEYNTKRNINTDDSE